MRRRGATRAAEPFAKRFLRRKNTGQGAHTHYFPQIHPCLLNHPLPSATHRVVVTVASISLSAWRTTLSTGMERWTLKRRVMRPFGVRKKG